MNQVFPIVPAPAKTLWSLGIFSTLIALLLALSLILAYSSRHLQLELSNSHLVIRGDLYGRTIPLSSLAIDRASIFSLKDRSAYQPKWRTNGIGLPGYRSGWFKLKNGEKALLFVTDDRKVVYLPTDKGYSLLMSVREPERFLDSLQEISKT